MLRVLFYLTVVAIIGGFLAFIAAEAGEVVLLIAGQRIVLPLFTATCLIIGLLIVILFVWWLARTLIAAPQRIRSYFGFRRERRFYQILSQGLIAAMSGDVQTARQLTKQSQALLGKSQEPLLPLLSAETKRLELDFEGAEELFQAMLDNPQTQLIGLKGLYREAMRKGDENQASLYAEQAVKIDARLEWAVRASITQCAIDENWGDALMFLDQHELAMRKMQSPLKTLSLKKSSKQNKDIIHWHLVLTCASAGSLMPNFPKLARDMAMRAHKQDPNFVPAAVIAAKSLFALGERKKAERLIENFWQKNPHPDLGEIYIEANNQLTTSDKLRRAERLERLNPEHSTSKMLVAQAALKAEEFEKARHKAEELAASTPTTSVFLLLADIHAALEHDASTIRHFLTQAVHAPADFVWMADGQIMKEWVAISPLSHRIGACQWQQPVKLVPPPVLALPALEVQAEPDMLPEPLEPSVKASETNTPLREVKDDMAQHTIIEPPTPPVIQAEAKSSPPQKTKKQTTQPTRLVVDDPGIEEDDNKP